MRGSESLRALALSLGVALLAACETPRATFTTGYRVVERLPATSSGPSLAVLPLEDARPPRAYGAQGRFFFTYVPLLPFVSIGFERLDESMEKQSEQVTGRGLMASAPHYDEYTYPRSFARAIADDLRASGLFREVHFVEAAESDGSDLVLRGSLRESPLRQTMTSYGLGAMGVLLWIIPLPMAKTSAGVTLDLDLVDAQTGKSLWTRSLESDVSRLATLYHPVMTYGRAGPFAFNLLPAPSDAQVDRYSLFSWHFEALRRAMLEVRPEVAEALAAAGR